MKKSKLSPRGARIVKALEELAGDIEAGVPMDGSHQAIGAGGRFRASPHASLQPFVVEYWGLARDLAAMGGFTITPDSYGELICCVDDLFVVGERGREKLPTCFLIGLLDGPIRLEADGVVRCMAARLRAWSIGPLLGGGSDRPSRGWSDAGPTFGAWLGPVADLVRRGDWPPLAGIFDQILRDEVDRWEPAAAGIEMAGEFLGDGGRPTGLVARERRIAARQVERRVRLLTGSSPKRLACLARFQKVRDAIWADPSADLARLAIEAGYSDQPHMTRHFRRYSGQTPARFARGVIARKNWLAAWHIAFVQEEGGGRG